LGVFFSSSYLSKIIQGEDAWLAPHPASTYGCILVMLFINANF
jgi:hypothetical protein